MCVCSALDKIIIQGYKALQLQYFFTAGHDEVKAWTIQVKINLCNTRSDYKNRQSLIIFFYFYDLSQFLQKGTKAPQAAGKIHTDFEKGFIMAEVMKFDDFKNEGSESGVKVWTHLHR